MAKTSQKNLAEYITPLNINGMQGRMLHMPAPTGKKREILFVYGHHSTLERWAVAVQDLNQYGAITMPDLPGFGGMDSFYSIGKEPTIDNLADYLATFIKLRYSRKRITLFGMSFGFVVATRMLQRYPELVKKVDLLVSVVGFAHCDDFVFSPTRMRLYRLATKTISRRIPSIFFKNICLHPEVLKLAYAKTFNAKKKFEGLGKLERKKTMDFEIHLWHANDLRTHAFTNYEFFMLDNCKQRINMPVWHISVQADRYFDNRIVEQHMRVIFSDFQEVKSETDTHAPSILAEADIAAKMIPLKVRQLLSEQV